MTAPRRPAPSRPRRPFRSHHSRPSHHYRLWPILALAACAGAPVRGPAYLDLVTSGALRPATGATHTAEALCADETRFAVAVADGGTLRATIAVADDATLVVGGCLDAGAAPAAPGAALEIAFEGAAVPTSTVPLDGPARWWRREIPLHRHAGERMRLALSLRGGSGGVLWLREVYLRQQVELPKRPAEPPAQVLLISVDTMRHDAIGALGGPWPTPHLDALVAASESFTRAYAASSWTKPSHGSLLTGVNPWVHGALDHETALHPGLPTLAERFAAAGFATAAVVQDIAHLAPRFGFDRGFEVFRNVDWQAAQMARWAVGWLGTHSHEPFFFFLHTFEVHSDFRHLPYEAPDIRVDDVDERFGVAGYGCSDGVCASQRLARINKGQIAPLAAEGEILRYLYGEGVRYLDAVLGQLFADLRALGLWDDLLIVLTSDHGELFLEHGKTLHGFQWEPVLRVPLIVKWPGGDDRARAGVRNDTPVAAIDVTATILAAGGVEIANGSKGALPGRDLAQPIRRERPIVAGTRARSIISGRFKLTSYRDIVRLYDLSADPGETRDLAAEMPEVAARMQRDLVRSVRADHKLLDALPKSAEEPERLPLSDEERERLRALGYLDG